MKILQYQKYHFTLSLMGVIAQTKYGTCARCGEKDTECKKRKKELLCLSCCRTEDNKKQVQKANDRNKIRGLYRKQLGTEEHFEAERAALIQDLDWTFSRVVRMKEADVHGQVECYTCGNRQHWSLSQCGHFEKRGNMLLRWDFRNARVQDKRCNEVLHGNYEVFVKKLNEEHPGLPELLKEESRSAHKWSRDELKQMLIDLRSKLRILESKFQK